MTSPTRWWISSSAACQEIRSNCPEPFTPTRRSGCSRRCGPCTKAVISRATLVQMTPSVNGIASEPRTFVMRPSSTVTVRLQVSGQSKVQTLGCSSRDIGGLRAETATINYPYVWFGGYNPVRAGEPASQPDRAADTLTVRMPRGSDARESAALTFNVSHLPIALAISGAAEIGTSKTAAAGSAEHDAVAAANKLRAAIVDRL